MFGLHVYLGVCRITSISGNNNERPSIKGISKDRTSLDLRKTEMTLVTQPPAVLRLRACSNVYKLSIKHKTAFCKFLNELTHLLVGVRKEQVLFEGGGERSVEKDWDGTIPYYIVLHLMVQCGVECRCCGALGTEVVCISSPLRTRQSGNKAKFMKPI